MDFRVMGDITGPGGSMFQSESGDADGARNTVYFACESVMGRSGEMNH
jgi:hypothetical protein